MKRTIPIHLAVEDELSEWVVRRALASRPVCYEIRTVRSRGGYGALKKQVPAYNLAARHTPFFVLTDLDQHACPPELIANWLCHPKHPQLLLRVAVREVEAWLLADTTGLPTFLGLRKAIAIPHPETLPNPKLQLLEMADSSPRRDLREALVSRDRKSRNLRQGPDYNGALARFISQDWNLSAARHKCPSLDRLFGALATLEQ